MLSVEAAKEIGINACIDKLGREFVLAHKGSATVAFGEIDNGVYCFVGVDDRGQSDGTPNAPILDSCSVFTHRASCSVDLTNGIPVFIECVNLL